MRRPKCVGLPRPLYFAVLLTRAVGIPFQRFAIAPTLKEPNLESSFA